MLSNAENFVPIVFPKLVKSSGFGSTLRTPMKHEESSFIIFFFFTCNRLSIRARSSLSTSPLRTAPHLGSSHRWCRAAESQSRQREGPWTWLMCVSSPKCVFMCVTKWTHKIKSQGKRRNTQDAACEWQVLVTTEVMVSPLEPNPLLRSSRDRAKDLAVLQAKRRPPVPPRPRGWRGPSRTG